MRLEHHLVGVYVRYISPHITYYYYTRSQRPVFNNARA